MAYGVKIMTDKLYYTDPLQAAWMAREFGVKFENEDDAAMFVIEGGDEYATLSQMQQTITSKKYYIHPDSYHIFEPQEGDVVEYNIICDKYPLEKRASHCLVTKTMMQTLGAIWVLEEIIQRNNTAFFMPLVEKDND